MVIESCCFTSLPPVMVQLALRGHVLNYARGLRCGYPAEKPCLVGIRDDQKSSFISPPSGSRLMLLFADPATISILSLQTLPDKTPILQNTVSAGFRRLRNYPGGEEQKSAAESTRTWKHAIYVAFRNGLSTWKQCYSARSLINPAKRRHHWRLQW